MLELEGLTTAPAAGVGAEAVLSDLMLDWTALVRSSGNTIEAVIAHNIAKLRARYPNGFVPGGGVR
jgi:hypothetical protein